MLATAMILIDGYYQQILQTNSYQNAQMQGLPGFYTPPVEYYPTHYYKDMTRYPMKDFLNPTKNGLGFELIDGKNDKTYAKAVCSNLDDKTFLIALNVEEISQKQAEKIEGKIKEILRSREKETICYLAILSRFKSDYFDVISKSWKPIKPLTREKNNTSESVNEDLYSTRLLFVKTRKKSG